MYNNFIQSVFIISLFVLQFVFLLRAKYIHICDDVFFKPSKCHRPKQHCILQSKLLDVSQQECPIG